MMPKSEVREVLEKVLGEYLDDTEFDDDQGDITNDILDKLEDRGFIDDDEDDEVEED